MRKIITVLAVAALLGSCSSGPERATKNFFENLSKGKVEEAKKYATESTGKVLDFASSVGTIPINPNYKFEMIKDSIVENKAWVTFINQEGGVRTIEVYNIDGEWLVDMGADK